MMFNVFLIVLLFPFVLLAQNKNYLTNPDFELGNTGYVSLGTQTLERTESGNLDQTGKQSIKLVGGNGDYIESRPTKIDETLSGKNCSVSIKYKLNSGAGYLTVFSGATVGSMTEINTDFRGVFESLSSAQSIRIASFPCPSSGFVKLRVQLTSASSSVNLDNAYLGLASFNEVSNVTSWKEIAAVAGTHVKAVTANPTFGTTVTINKLLYRVVGSALEVIWTFNQTTAGTSGTGTYLLDLSTLGYSFDMSKLVADNTDSLLGSMVGNHRTWSNSSSAFSNTGTCHVYNSTTIKCNGTRSQGSSGNAGDGIWSSANGAAFNAANLSINIHLTIPITGQMSSTVINAECPDQYACVDTFTASFSTSGVKVTNSENVSEWIVGNGSYSSGVTTLTLRTSLFSSAPVCTVSVSGGQPRGARVTSVSTTSVVVTTWATADSSVQNVPFDISCTRSGSDFKGKRILQAQLPFRTLVYQSSAGGVGVNGNFVEVYSDGWVRQGFIGMTGTPTTNTFTVEFSDANYMITGAHISSDTGTASNRGAAVLYAAKTATSVQTYASNRMFIAEGWGKSSAVIALGAKPNY